MICYAEPFIVNLLRSLCSSGSAGTKAACPSPATAKMYTYVFSGPWYVRVPSRCSPPTINLLSVAGKVVCCFYQLSCLFSFILFLFTLSTVLIIYIYSLFKLSLYTPCTVGSLTISAPHHWYLTLVFVVLLVFNSRFIIALPVFNGRQSFWIPFPLQCSY